MISAPAPPLSQYLNDQFRHQSDTNIELLFSNHLPERTFETDS